MNYFILLHFICFLCFACNASRHMTNNDWKSFQIEEQKTISTKIFSRFLLFNIQKKNSMYLKMKKEIFWGAFLCIFYYREHKKKVCFWASNRDILSFGMVKKSFLFFTMDTISCRAAWAICTRFMFLTCLMPWIKKNVFPSSMLWDTMLWLF